MQRGFENVSPVFIPPDFSDDKQFVQYIEHNYEEEEDNGEEILSEVCQDSDEEIGNEDVDIDYNKDNTGVDTSGDQTPSSTKRGPRQFISRAEWFRYMSCHHGKFFNDPHWLWDWGDLNQYYTISYCNRMQAEKVGYLKKLQDQKKFVRSRALLDYLEKVRQKECLCSFFCFFLRLIF